jgi:hypothetical protein
MSKPLTVSDLDDVRAWAENVVTDANGWAERAEVSRGERNILARHLDVIASRAREVTSLVDVLTNR